MKRKHLILIPLIAVILMAAGQCDKYRKTGQLARDFAAGVSAFQQTEIVLHQQGKIDNAEHLQIQGAILEVAQDGKKLDAAINLVHSAPDAKTALDASISAVSNALSDGALHVKNPDAKAELQTSIVLLESILHNIQAIGGQ